MSDTEYTDMPPRVLTSVGYVEFRAHPDTDTWTAKIWAAGEDVDADWLPLTTATGSTMTEALDAAIRKIEES